MDLSTSYTIKAKVTGQDQISGLKTGLDKLKTSSNNAANAMGRLKGMAGQALGALKGLVPVLGIAGIGKLVNDTLELGDMLQKLSVTSGVSVEMLDKLRISSQLAGTDFKALQRAFPVLAKNMQDASDGVGTAKEAFDRIGFSAVDSTGKLKSMDVALLEIADLMRNTKDSTLNLANANEIFGGGVGRKLVPLLQEGSEAIMALNNGFSQDNAENMAGFNDRVTLMGEKFNILKIQLTDALLPALDKIVSIISFAAEKFAALPAPIKAIGVAFALLVPAVLALAPALAALIFSFKTIAAVKMGVVIAKITTAFGGVIAAVKGAALAFAPFMSAAAIPLAIIGVGVLIFKFRDQIGQAFAAIGEFLYAPFRPFVQFVGNIFNGGMEMARNAFNKLPNIVQQAIKVATAPLRGFISFLQKILSLLGRVRKAKANPPKPSSSTSSTSTSTSTSTSKSSSSGIPSLPRTYGYQESNLSAGNIGSGYKGFTPSFPMAASTGTKTTKIPSQKKSNLSVTKLPSGGYSISGSGKKSKTPNVNIKTGNVTQIDGTNYVTTKDLQKAVQSATAQTMNYIQAGGVKHYL